MILRSRLGRFAGAVVALLLVVACDPQRELPSATPARASAPSISEEDAVRLVRESSEFRTLSYSAATLFVPRQVANMSVQQRAAAEALVRQGWIVFEGSAAHVRLTDRARKDRRFFDRDSGIEVSATAVKQITRVISIRSPTAATRNVSVEWRWVPNDIGMTLPKGSLPNSERTNIAEAVLAWDGLREWYLTRLTPH